MATAFLAAMTASQLLGAWVISVFGPRVGYIGSVVIFTVGSILGASAPNIDILILARVIQGFAAGVVQPLAMVTIFSRFSARTARISAECLWRRHHDRAGFWSVIVGGITIDASSWRELFFIPLPIAGIAMLMGAIFMRPAIRM